MTDRPTEAPEWLWYGEADGKPIVTFGRWPKNGGIWRYKYAEIQPTEHDHSRSHATHGEQLEFLIGETRKALAVFAVLPLPEYFRRNQEGDKLAFAIEQASDHLAVALNVLAAQPKKLVTSQRRCDTNFVGGMGECLACDADQGEACRKPLVIDQLPETVGTTHTGSLAAAVSVTRDNYHAVLDDVAQALNDEPQGEN